MSIDVNLVIYGLTFIGAVFGFLAGLLRLLKRWGLIRHIPFLHVPDNGPSTLEKLADSPITELAVPILTFFRQFLCKTNPDLIHNAAQEISQLIANHYKDSNEAFAVIVEHDEELKELILAFLKAVQLTDDCLVEV